MALVVTNIADVDRDPISGRKLLNQYEIIDELGRGVHGKVKLGRNPERNQDVAIKIVDRYSKRRRLGKLGDPEENVKREVAILKKAIHPNVVALLEVIDDPAKKKVYIVLEFVQLGEIEWRAKGAAQVAHSERRRVEREKQGLDGDGTVRVGDGRMMEARREWERLEQDRVKSRPLHDVGPHIWSLEHGGGDGGDESPELVMGSARGEGDGGTGPPKGRTSPWHEPSGSVTATGDVRRPTPASPMRHASDGYMEPQRPYADRETPTESPQRLFTSSRNSRESLAAMHGAGSISLAEAGHAPGRAPSYAGSFISNLSSDVHYDPFEEDFSYVPCLTVEQARRAFRDTVLGLEYLHYQGIIHRDIKPANLLWTSDHRVKISDFGVSYLGRPIRDDDTGEDLSEADARPLDEAVELAKTVGTPAFYAPELCCTDLTGPRPPVTGQIDVWALGVTLYCLLFARVPFLAENEFALFKAITDDRLYIPRKRLRPVRPQPSLRAEPGPYASPRLDHEFRAPDQLEYEEIDDDLVDLLKRILEKDPTKRIMIKEIKRHPFTLQGLADPIRWIEETDPARQYQGKKIEVSSEDVERAVVPIGFLARMKSNMRKMGAAIGFGAVREGRRRAKSTANSADGTASGTASTTSTSPTPTVRDDRRRSVRPEEALYAATRVHREVEHPLSRSVAVTPEHLKQDPFAAPPPPPLPPPPPPINEPALAEPRPWLDSEPPEQRPDFLQRTISTSTASTSTASTATVVPSSYRDTHNRTPRFSPSLPENPTAVGSIAPTDILGAFRRAGRRDSSVYSGRGGEDNNSHRTGLRRPPSVDLVRNMLEDQRGEPSVAVSNASATGHVDPSPYLSDGPGHGGSAESVLIRPGRSMNRLSMPLPQRQWIDQLQPAWLSSAPASPGLSSATAAPEQRHWAVEEVLGHTLNPSSHHPHEGEDPGRAQDVRHTPWILEESGPSPYSMALVEDSVPTAEHSITSDELPRRQPWEASTDPNEPETAHHPGSADPDAISPRPAPVVTSSSEEQFTSGISQSTSYPSMPSTGSAGSSIYVVDDASPYRPKRDSTSLPPFNRPPDMHPARPYDRPSHLSPSDDEAGYHGDTAVASDDDDDEDEDDDDDDGDDLLLMTRRKPRNRGSGKRRSGPEEPPPRQQQPRAQEQQQQQAS